MTLAAPRRRTALKALALASLTASTDFALGAQARWLPWPARRKTPQVALIDLDGAPWQLAQEAGHPVLLNFWASWCEPCRAEMQSFAVLERQFAATGLKVVAVNFKEAADTVRRFRAWGGPSGAWLRDSYGEAADAFGVRTFPTSVLVDRQGRARLRVVGEVDWADPPVHQKLATWV